MKRGFLLLVALLCGGLAMAQNRAPSIWLNYQDKAEGDIIMTKVRVPSGKNPVTTYYSTLNFNSGAEMGGYAGIQNHDYDGHIFIFSIWDPIATTEAIKADYSAEGVEIANFGGEGTGLRSKHKTYQWKEGFWYNTVLRTWQYNNHTFVGYFVQDESTGMWEHFVTMDFPVANVPFNSGGTGSFLENWYPKAGADGAYGREMHMKDGYKRRTNGSWMPFSSANFNRVSPDAGASNYINNFDGATTSDYWFMASGGSYSPSTASGTMAQLSMNASPSLSTGKLASVTPNFNANTYALSVDWILDKTKSPQLSYSLEIFDNASFTGSPVKTVSDIRPHIRTIDSDLSGLSDGVYYARLSITDIFDQQSTYETFSFTKGNVNIDNDVAMSSVALDGSLNCDGEGAFTYTVLNNGNNALTSFFLEASLNGNVVHSETKSVSIASKSAQSFTLNLSGLNLTGNDAFKLNVSQPSGVSDENSANNSKTITLISGTIDQSSISVVSYSTQEASGEGAGNGQVIHALDGDANTFWHSQWTGAGATLPFELVLDLGKNYELSELAWLNRQNNTNGYAKNIDVFASNSTSNWGTAKNINLTSTTDEQTLNVSGLTGQYVKIRVNTTMSGEAIGAIAELNFAGCETSVPSVTADFSADKTTAYSCSDVTYTANTTGAISSYAWDFGAGATPATATGIGPHTVSYATTGAKTVSLTVNGNLTETKTSYVTISQDPSRQPSLSVSYDATEICEGTSVQATVSNVQFGGSNPQFQWMVNNQTVATNGNQQYSFSNLTDGDQLSVTLVSDEECVTSQTASTANQGITVNALVTPKISIVPDKWSLCEGELIGFNANTSDGTVEWMLNGSLVGNGNRYTTTTLNSTDKVVAVVTSSGECLTTNKVESNELSLKVDDVVTPSISINADLTEICEGEQVNFTATTNGGSVSWLLNDNAVSSGSSYFTTSLQDGDQVKAVLTSDAECATSSTATSNMETITVNDIVTPSISIIADKTEICNGEQVNFTATSNGGSVSWLLNNTAVSNGSSYSNSNLNDGDQVKAVLTSNAKCATVSSATSNVETITVGTSVTPSISISADKSVICEGEEVSFTATTNGGSVTWELNNNQVGTGLSYSTTILKDGDQVKAVVTTNSSCATTNTATSNTETVTVNTPTTPAISITAEKSLVCQGEEVSFMANASSGTVNWFVNNNLVGEGAQFKTANITDGDIVSAELTSDEACVTTQIVASNQEILNVEEPLNPSIEIELENGEAFPVCQNMPLTFGVLTNEEGSNPSYTWKVDNVVVGQGASYTSSSLKDGQEIICEMVVSESCVVNSSVVSPTVVADVLDANDSQCITSTASPTFDGVRLYPNPTSDMLHIEGIGADTKVSLFSPQGVLVYEGFGRQILMSSLPAGIYSVKLQNGESVVFKSVVKK